MEVGSYAPRAGAVLDDLFAEQVRFDRSDTEALDALYLVEGSDEVEEVLAPSPSEVPDIHAGEHDLTTAHRGDTLCFGDDLTDGATTATPTGLGDGAVGTVVVTAVLYLEEVTSALVGGRAESEGANILRSAVDDAGGGRLGDGEIQVLG